MFPSRQRAITLATVTVSGLLVALIYTSTAQSLPPKISDRDFWIMISSFSEAGGGFVSDNVVSNEIEFQHVIPNLLATSRGGVYVGVGPEQNFTYIVALTPAIAFIVDIRRGNLLLHLVYKALIEASRNRIDFLTRLFARSRPSVDVSGKTARELFEIVDAQQTDADLARATLVEIFTALEIKHSFALTDDDKRGVAAIYRSFYEGGPQLKGDFGGGKWIPSYSELMSSVDLRGLNHTYLESERNFRLLKQYEERNLIIPVVGDFAGSRALQSVGRFTRAHNATVTTFYVSNVEEYLFKASNWNSFIGNVRSLPTTKNSIFIRSFFTHSSEGLWTMLDPIQACIVAASRGEVSTYRNVIARSKRSQ